MLVFMMIIVIGALVSGQMILKAGLPTLYRPRHWTIHQIGMMIYHNLTSPYMIASLMCTLVAGLTWLLIVSRYSLGKVYPLISLNYVGVFLLSVFFFKESVTMGSLIGLFLIGLGTFMLGTF